MFAALFVLLTLNLASLLFGALIKMDDCGTILCGVFWLLSSIACWVLALVAMCQYG